jgi:transcriptional regulator GlxA family with amidase domain
MADTSVAIIVFDEVEVLDACGPFEVFSVSNRVAGRHHLDTTTPFEVRLVAAGDDRAVVARGGLRLAADHTLADAPYPDIVLMPGGVIDTIEHDQRLHNWLRAARDRAELVASVCTGAFVLAEAGLLTGAVTTHWEDLATLRGRLPRLDVRDDVRYIDRGDVATSAGVSAGIDLCLHIVSRYRGAQLAEATARQMDYPWNPDSGQFLPPVAGEGLI